MKKERLHPLLGIALEPQVEDFDKIRDGYERVLQAGFKEAILITTASRTQGWIHGVPRISALIAGSLRQQYFDGQEKKVITLEPGRVAFTSREGFLNHIPQTPQPFSGFSILYFGKMVRFVYSETRLGEDGKLCLQSSYYHTRKPLVPEGERLIEALTLHGENSFSDPPARLMIEALFRISWDSADRERESAASPKIAQSLWGTINSFLARNRHYAYSRDEVGKLFHISPSYLSRLFQRFSGKTFTQVQNEYRLMLAHEYLLTTDWSVKQVAAECGYENVAYFVKLFRERYQLPPGQLRAESCQDADATPN